MSVETMKWLNTMTRIGYTEKRGTAWHYKREQQEGRGNHFIGPVPKEEVMALFFDAVEGYAESSYMTPDGFVNIRDERRKCILRPPGTFGPDDKGGILNDSLLLGQPGEPQGWKLHQYREWLVETFGRILDTPSDDIGIASAGLLQQGAMAWVQIETPENVETPEGFTFRPFLLAATAHTGNMSTVFKQAVTAVVCDNTLSAGLAEGGGTARIRHTRNSEAKAADLRSKLGILHTVADEFSRQVAELSDITVSDGDFEQILALLAPPTVDKKTGLARLSGQAKAKREKIERLYRTDPRVTPWAGSAFGVWQAVNTFEHHVQGTTNKTGDEVAQRNMLRVVKGDRDRMDADTVKLIREVVAA